MVPEGWIPSVEVVLPEGGEHAIKESCFGGGGGVVFVKIMFAIMLEPTVYEQSKIITLFVTLLYAKKKMFRRIFSDTSKRNSTMRKMAFQPHSLQC